MGRNLLGRGTQAVESGVGQDGPRPAHSSGRAVLVRQRAGAVLHQSFARVADRIRSSTEGTGGYSGPEQRAAGGVPWLGLLLWMFACAALFVSLVMQADDLDRERRVATRSEIQDQVQDRAGPLPGLTRQASGLNLFTVPRPPSN